MSEQGEPLSEREIEILSLVATGAANKEIALRLSISPNTVKVHLRRIFIKIGVASRTEATLYAIRSGIVPREAALLGEPPELEAEESPSESTAATVISPPTKKPLIQDWRWRVTAALVLLLVAAGSLAAFFLRPAPVLPPPATPAAPLAASPQRWAALNNLATARKGMAAVSSENAFYLIGGVTPSGISQSTLRFLPLANRWEELTPKPTPTTDIQAAILGEKIYVPGGQLPNGAVSNVLEVFDPRRNQWEQHAPLPQALSQYALAAFEGRLYLFGGWTGKEYSAEVYQYDPSQDVWERRQPLKSPRALSAAVTGRDRIYLMGGYDGQQALNENLSFFPTRGQSGETVWEERAPLPKPRYAMGAAMLADLIFLVGGVSKPDAGKENPAAALPLLEYVPPSDQWLTLDTPLQEVGSQPAVVTFSNYLHIFGGEGKNGASAGHQTYQAIYTIGIPIIKDQ